MKRIATASLLLFFLLSSYSFSVGRTAQMNLAFSIGAKDDNITVANDYVAAQDSSVVLAMVSSGLTASTGNVTAYSPTEYLLQMSQALENNRFLITFTNATNQTIENKLKFLGDRKILPKTFGSFSPPVPSSVFLFLRLEYSYLDLTTRQRWGASPVQLIIKNNGNGNRGTLISIGMAR